ncbi:D-TA family PLP-dependent enzyme [Mucilaginibacter segetis]|uniref:D-TA family PLP-dependent enzyme n=1 Tax=Mucilaginibacter segetis TaxID=2793071 RepID=A0A934UMP4_9SPHI|nr:D-TA family PLP-dependent enzyme [Mucilaginibacter segetis]MBK0379102.1 D-TA family PLP-dependent enzyme [Mucilaginibacter segetis]
MTSKQWYIIDNADELDSPALVVYPQRVKANIQQLIGMINDVSRLRPHVKTHKSAEVTRLMLAAGITKFKCATIAEAEMLGVCKAPDVLLAYQPIGLKIDRFIQLINKYPDTVFSCLVDNQQSGKIIAKKANLSKLNIPVYIDLNVGMNRTGICPGDDAIELYKSCANLQSLTVLGFHAYDGHIHQADYNVRERLSAIANSPLFTMVTRIIALGYSQPKLIIGGSPTFPLLAKMENIECSPGTFVYWDRGYQLSFPEQKFLPAALILARIISLPDETKICIDVGHKAVSAENELDKRISFMNAPELKFVSQSEEHLVADAGEDHPYKVGDVLYGLPYHICPTIALYNSAITIEDSCISGAWLTTARNRKITI